MFKCLNVFKSTKYRFEIRPVFPTNKWNAFKSLDLKAF
jgi:hypothetical protein